MTSGCSSAALPHTTPPATTTPVLSGALQAVSCPSADRCVAAGVGGTGGPASAVRLAAWDAGTWSTLQGPDSLDGAEVAAISCAGDASCMAVGTRDGSALVLELAGGSWRTTAPPAGTGELLDVDCAGPAECEAVGVGAGGPVVASWHGARWSVYPVSGLPAGAALAGVSCVAPGRCVAVGDIPDGVGDEPLVEVVDGGRVTTVPSPRLPVSIAAPGGTLDAVDCAGGASCLAVGSAGDRMLAVRVTLAGGASATASLLATPPAMSGGSFAAFRLSCSGDRFCMAASSLTGSSTRPFFETWDGGAWALAPTPALPPSAGTAGITAVSCGSPSSCLAVGSQAGASVVAGTPLVERWDGSAWAVAAPPAAGSAPA